MSMNIPTTEKVQKSVVLVSADDWQGLYINEKLCIEGHCIYAWDVLNELSDANVITARHLDVPQDWMESRGTLPSDLFEVRSI